MGLLPLRRREREYALILGGGAATDCADDETEEKQQQQPGKRAKPADVTQGAADVEKGAPGGTPGSSRPAGGLKTVHQSSTAQQPMKRLGSLSDPVTVARGAPRSLGRLPAVLLRAGSSGPAK